jgi:hypothetical protein
MSYQVFRLYHCRLISSCHHSPRHLVVSQRFFLLQARLFATTTPSSTPQPSASPRPPPENEPRQEKGNGDDKIMSITAEDVMRRGNALLDSFFTEASQRSKRRRRRLEARRRRRENLAAKARKNGKEDDDNDDDWVDDRTVRQILFPMPSDYFPEEAMEERKNRKTFREHLNNLPSAWAEYKDTWRGFWSSGVLVIPPEERKESGENSEENEQLTPSAIQRQIRRNIRRNTKVATKTALYIRQQVRDRTGIHSAEDMRRVAAESMLLLSQCLDEFVSGYREGKDAQIRQMLEEDLERQRVEKAKKDNPPRAKKRRPKRRILVR